jgi:hypothetical protein
LVPLLLEFKGDRFLIGENDEVVGLQYVAEMFHRLVDRQQLPVVGAILLLSGAVLPGEECEGLPGILHALL